MNRFYRALKSVLLYSVVALVSLLVMSCDRGAGFYSNTLRSELFIQQYSNERLDFLWVMDNSDSMAPKREYIKNNIQLFMNTIKTKKAVDFSMAVTTTDVGTPDPKYHGLSWQGKLVTSADGTSVVKSADASPFEGFGRVMDGVTTTPTSFWEQGLEAAYQAISNNGSAFMRPNTPLVIVFASDETSYDCAGDCTGGAPETHLSTWAMFPLDRYTSFLKEFSETNGIDIYVFPIVGLAEASCDEVNVGTRYLDLLAAHEKGKSGSICENDLPKSFSQIAEFLRDKTSHFTLAEIVATDLGVAVNGALVQPSAENGYIFDSTTNTVIFTGDSIPAVGSKIEITYSRE